MLVDNVSTGGFQSHDYGNETEAERQSKNRWNVALYFQLTSADQTILQLAAGDHVYPGALSEDVNQYTDKTEPKLLANVGEQLTQYLPAGQRFAKVLVINARNLIRRNTDYQWLFETAAPVMQPGATIVIVGVDQNQPAIAWATANELAISKLGFTKLSPVAAGAVEAAPPDIRAMQGSTSGGPGGGMIAYSMANAMQVVWRKN
jgi:hypothetical protein